MALPHAQYVIAEASTPVSGVNSNQVKTVSDIVIWYMYISKICGCASGGQYVLDLLSLSILPTSSESIFIQLPDCLRKAVWERKVPVPVSSEKLQKQTRNYYAL